MGFYPLRRLIVPIVLLTAAGFLLNQWPELRPVYTSLLLWLPYLTLAAALLLAAFYNRGRLFVAALLLALAYWLIRAELQAPLEHPRPHLIFALVSLCLPLTVLALLLLPERGLVNRYGLMMSVAVPGELAGGWLLLNQFPRAGDWLIQRMPALPLEGWYLSVTATVCFAAAFLAALFVLYRRDSEHAASLAGVLTFGFVTLMFFGRPGISSVMFSAAGLGLVIGLVRGSHELAFRDELTGLYGRRALNERLYALGRHCTLAVLDVDHFKQFNDTYGHDAGDEVLKMVASQLDRVGGGGRAYRFGGEEFCIAFPGKRLEQCRPHLEAVRAAIEEYRFSLRDRKSRPGTREEGRRLRGRRDNSERTVQVTVSIGAAERTPERSKPSQVLEAADAALYKAKKNGRNRLES